MDPRLRDGLMPLGDRMDAGRKLSPYVSGVAPDNACICAIPAGGAPVGVETALALRLRIFLAIVQKIKIPGNPEAGLGAVTWDCRVHLNERLLAGLDLSKGEIADAIAAAQANVRERITRFGASGPFPCLAGKCAILVDDMPASGYTMIAAVNAIRACDTAAIIGAVPSGPAGVPLHGSRRWLTSSYARISGPYIRLRLLMPIDTGMPCPMPGCRPSCSVSVMPDFFPVHDHPRHEMRKSGRITRVAARRYTRVRAAPPARGAEHRRNSPRDHWHNSCRLQ